jgi:ATP-dependent helicase/nuclease subunit B
MRELGLAPAEFLPYSASFARFTPTYLDWLSERERQGQRFERGEVERRVRPWAEVEPALAELTLLGRIDRVDDTPEGTLLIDYKTGSLKGLKDKVADPLEDTQLAVYAVLMNASPEARPPNASPGPSLSRDAGEALPPDASTEDSLSRDAGEGMGERHSGSPPALRAQYLALDDAKGIAAIEHEEVAHTAAIMLTGLRADLLSVHAGAPLPALGEGVACAYCEMRGLCRRDDWEGAAP